jgi:hypothetical protein
MCPHNLDALEYMVNMMREPPRISVGRARIMTRKGTVSEVGKHTKAAEPGPTGR